MELVASRSHQAVAAAMLLLFAGLAGIVVRRLFVDGADPALLVVIVCWSFGSTSIRSLIYGPGFVELDSEQMRIHRRPLASKAITIDRDSIAATQTRDDRAVSFGIFGKNRHLDAGVAGASLQKPNVLIRLDQSRRFNVRLLAAVSHYPPHQSPLRRWKD